jgi:hypothetical protein
MRYVLALLFLLVPSTAFSGLLPYGFALHVEQTIFPPGISHPIDPFFPVRTYPLDTQPGHIFHGHFYIDSNVLATDGFKDNQIIKHFWLQIGDIVWDQDRPYFVQPDPSDFASFHSDVTTFGTSPDLVVQGGKLVGFGGGVFSGGDSPYVDFGPPATFLAATGNILFTGRISILQAPEPGVLALLLLPLAFLFSARPSIKPRDTEKQIKA